MDPSLSRDDPWLGQALGWGADPEVWGVKGKPMSTEQSRLLCHKLQKNLGNREVGQKTLLLQERSLMGFRSFVGSGGLELIIKEVLSISVFLCVLDLSKGNRVSLCEGLSFFFCFKRLLSPRRLQVIRDMGAYSVLQ